MNKLNLIFGGTILAAVFAVSGCGKNKMVTASEEYAEKACACKDADCVKKASEDYTKLAAEAAKDAPSASDAKLIGDAVTKATGCMTKLMSAPPAAK